MSTTVRLSMIGGLGNRMFQWAHAKAFCEQNGHELRCEPWVGERIFTLDGYVPIRPDGTEQIQLFGYFQSQADLIYSRADCRRWFNTRPEIERRLYHNHGISNWSAAHFRRGDYAGAGYPLISRKAVEAAMIAHGIDGPCIPVSDETPTGDPDFTGDLSMLPDFYRLMRAPVLFRANSTFSWWAATLSHARVFSPVITGLAGGVEHDDVPYVEGNWPKCADGMSFVTDLHLRES